MPLPGTHFGAEVRSRLRHRDEAVIIVQNIFNGLKDVEIFEDQCWSEELVLWKCG